MSATAFFTLIVLAWVAIGVMTSLVMNRRGHRLFSWAMLGAVFGPLVLVLAIDAVRTEQRAAPRRLRTGLSEEGPVDVLAGIDGSAESAAAVRASLALFGPRIGRLTLAAVVDYEAGLSQEEWRREKPVADLLAEAEAHAGRHAEAVLLTGPPAETLVKYANEGGYDTIVIGSRGKGASKALLGSVAKRLAADATVPVLIGGR